MKNNTLNNIYHFICNLFYKKSKNNPEKWRNIENISSRIIEIWDDKVVLECLIDKDSNSFEERIFDKDLFNCFSPLKLGSLFLLKIFKKENEMKIQILEGEGLVSREDFNNPDFNKILNNCKLFENSTRNH